MKKINFSLTAYNLKIIGIILMVFDHIAQFWGSSAPIWFHWLGRPVFPIFLFLSVEGFTHTRNKKKYMRGLLIGFWFMGICSRIIQRLFESDNLFLMNNVFGTLFLAVLYMYLIEKIKEAVKRKDTINVLFSIGLMILPILYYPLMLLTININVEIFSVMYLIFPTVFTVEGGALMVLFGILLYIFRKNRLSQIAVIIAFSAVSLIGNTENIFTSNYQWMMVSSIIPIYLYNGLRGGGNKYFFYVFYPAHIYILYFVFYFLEKAKIIVY